MTKVLNDPRTFREEMIEGFVAAYGRYVRRASGASGILSVAAPTPGKVAVVVGGGSGHYPAFYGLVGDGMASAAVIGDVFTSPSGEQAYRVAREVDGGAGVLSSFGNYSGDVMNFGMAEMRLRSEGIDARTVLVTDDVLSAPAEEWEQRRGIAGGFYVFKTSGASASRGDGLAEVESITRHANSRVRTGGVAFNGCTLPGSTQPLFTVDPGRMEIGLGIHGEPGVRTSELLPAREIAKLLVETILADAPPDAGSKVAVLINGLGATKYEELFVLYAEIAPLLREAGLETHEPLIGEFVTSLDMAGCSLSLFWLDDDLERLHDAPTVTPAFTRGGGASAAASTRSMSGTTWAGTLVSESPRRSRMDEESDRNDGPGGQAGIRARVAIAAALTAVEAAEDELGRLDAAAGDGDHGAGMTRGFRAAVAAIAGVDESARRSLVTAGQAFMDQAGGASGALVGGWLVAMGQALPPEDNAVDAASWGTALRQGLAALARLGGAEVGDKTMLDTLVPFVDAFTAGDGDLPTVWGAALPAAEAGMRGTVEMISRRGRASRLGERSRGVQDAGATSMYYVLRAFGEAFAAHPDVE